MLNGPPSHDTSSRPPLTDLDRLDRALFEARQWFRRPGHRRRVWEALSTPVELTTVRVLRAIEAVPDGPTVGEIGRALGVAPSTASRFVDRVVERGEASRHACKDDARRTRVAMTQRGRAMLDEITEARRSVLSEATDGWSAEDVHTLADLLERMGQRFDELEEQG